MKSDNGWETKYYKRGAFMSNVTFLWIFSRGIELGVIIVCLLPLRALFRRKFPRLFSYILWVALPANIVYHLVMNIILGKFRGVADFVHRIPKVVVDEDVVRIMKWCWIGGTIIVILWLAVSYISFLQRLVGCIRLQKGVYLTDRIRAPFTLGLFCPKIYLPVSLKEEYYRYVILHERVHISRRDVWMKYLAVGFLGLFWFQPLLWFACRLFVNDMEEACDETVIRKESPEFREEYAKALVEISFLSGKVSGAVIGYGNGAIKSRIKNIVNYKKIRLQGYLMAVMICLLFIVASVLISWQVPRMVQRRHEVEIEAMVLEKTGVTKEAIISNE